MDAAYDHIQEESYPEDPAPQSADRDSSKRQSSDFTAEVQDAYKAISSSPWAARLGGFLGSVKKQGEQYYDGARKEYTPVIATATSSLTGIINRTRSLSLQTPDPAAASSSTTAPATTDKDGDATSPAHPDRPDSLPADIVKEAEGMLSRFRLEATKRLKDIERAEDAADEALLKFGANIRNFLRDAVTIAPPTSPDGSGSNDPSKVLFESKDSDGKRVIHTTRFDAQLHVIHSSLESFVKDPVSPEWEAWSAGFAVDAKTEAIARDLEKHEELRRAMEKLVPEKVEYGAFWKRYYFLRHVIESEERKRREMLKASAPIEEEEIGWDEDSEDEDTPNVPSTSNPTTNQQQTKAKVEPKSKATEKEASDEEESSDEDEEESSEEEDSSDDESSAVATPNPALNKSKGNPLAASKETLKPKSQPPAPARPAVQQKQQTTPTKSNTQAKPVTSPRRSNDEKSIADSDASYDLVSGATSRAPGSPREVKKGAVAEESDEEDWE